MKTTLLLLSLLPIVAFAKDPFEGTWKARMDSFKTTGSPDVFELKDGTFSCKSCAPPYSIKADGTMQKTPENAYRDMVSFKATGPSSAEWSVQKGGKPISKIALSVSADGKVLTQDATNYVGTTPSTFKGTANRMAAGAPGSHAVSGSWQNATLASASAAALTTDIAATPNGLKYGSNGTTVDAKFDGKEYETMGDPGHTMVTLKRISDHEIEETDRSNGKVTDIVSWKASDDGKTISFSDEDKLHNTTTTFVEDRMK
ncbi:MAG: hypothetical protein ACRETU_02860 [Steroidobacterales bacterium]